MNTTDFADVPVVEGDLDSDLAVEFELAGKEHGLAVDLETTGLSFRDDHIEVVTLAVPDRAAVVLVEKDRVPYNLSTLLTNGSILKIYHHALFDLAFCAEQWDVLVEPVFCTKVAARIAGVSRNPTLQLLVAELFDIGLDKTERMSDWSSRPLSEAQKRYAVRDVIHLHALRQELIWKLSDVGRSALLENCMQFLPSRVELARLALDDVFAYEL